MWWVELRTEIRSHMRAMGCHVVLGYSEQTSIRGELIILSAVGTAALIDMSYLLGTAPPPMLRQRQLSGSGPQPAATLADDEVTHHHRHKLHVDVALANEVAFNGPHVDTNRWSILISGVMLIACCIHTNQLQPDLVASYDLLLGSGMGLLLRK